MNETALKKRIKKITVYVVLISLAVMCGSVFTSIYLRGQLQRMISLQETNTDINFDNCYRVILISRLLVVIVLIGVLLLLAYGYYMIYKSNHTMIQSAYYDPVTGAYNRTKFMEIISGTIENTQEYGLTAINVRQFKFINEIFGSQQGDDLLRHIKKIISENIRPGEHYCRGEEDMFYILMRDTDRNVIRSRLEQIISRISIHAENYNRNYKILLYCGVVIGTDVQDPDPSAQKSMIHVRFALRTARQSLKNSIWFYDTELHEKEIMENFVESHMYQALEDEEFKMYLQPKIKLKDGTTGGAEALVRWIPKSGKMIYPGQFIPLFEKNGFCVILDKYMVELVCRQLREWIDQGAEPVPISVNQSKLIFYEPDYIDNMKALIDKYKIPADLITLEILEGLAIGNTDELNEKITKLRNIGFRISMDDFGSGYSSLNTLATLKINELKLDRVFLPRMKNSGEDQKRQIIILEEILDLTKKLRITTVAEGVETKENEELIRSLGCDMGQGYYYCRPVDVSEFSEKYIRSRTKNIKNEKLKGKG